MARVCVVLRLHAVGFTFDVLEAVETLGQEIAALDGGTHAA